MARLLPALIAVWALLAIPSAAPAVADACDGDPCGADCAETEEAGEDDGCCDVPCPYEREGEECPQDCGYCGCCPAAASSVAPGVPLPSHFTAVVPCAVEIPEDDVPSGVLFRVFRPPRA